MGNDFTTFYSGYTSGLTDLRQKYNFLHRIVRLWDFGEVFMSVEVSPFMTQENYVTSIGECLPDKVLKSLLEC